MSEYKAVLGSHPLSIRIFDLLADTAPGIYPESMRVSIIGTINDILQGRSKLGTTADWLLGELREKAGEDYPERTETLCREVKHFQAQKAMLTIPYTKSSDKEYQYEIWDYDAKRPLKRIDQRLYDSAAKAGFPPDFFKQSYFDGVTIYCMPDFTELDGSIFQGCSFNVCRIVGAHFYDTSIYGSEFQSCLIQDTSFSIATLDHTHFHDTAMSGISFNSARLSACNTIDCAMSDVSFHSAMLDGCSYGRIKASGIQGMENATITMGGATDRECAQNKASIFEALGVTPPTPSHKRSAPAPPKPKHHTGPER